MLFAGQPACPSCANALHADNLYACMRSVGWLSAVWVQAEDAGLCVQMCLLHAILSAQNDLVYELLMNVRTQHVRPPPDAELSQDPCMDIAVISYAIKSAGCQSSSVAAPCIHIEACEGNTSLFRQLAA